MSVNFKTVITLFLSLASMSIEIAWMFFGFNGVDISLMNLCTVLAIFIINFSEIVKVYDLLKAFNEVFYNRMIALTVISIVGNNLFLLYDFSFWYFAAIGLVMAVYAKFLKDFIASMKSNNSSL